MKILIVLLGIGLATGAVAETEYGCFSRPTSTDAWSPVSVILNEGESIVFLNAWSVTGGSTMAPSSEHYVNVSGYVFSLWEIRYYNNSLVYPELQRTINGPCTISIPTEGVSIVQARYKIIRNSDIVSTSPMNIVSLPDDNNGDVDLLVETSTDLQSWTPVYSGSAGTSNNAAFFRTRLIQN